MNEVINISIAGIAFIFDTDAYEALKAYLDNLKKAYGSNPDGNEIITDIEARIVELILSRQSIETVVAKNVITDIVGQLGTPDDISEDGTENEGSKVPYYSDEEQFPRRFYRDSENSKLGGVCSGLGRYFNMDPVTFRIGIFVPVLLLIIVPTLGSGFLNNFLGFLGSLFGAIVLLYIVLWIAVPVAKTPRQKLEMRGKKITAHEIERVMSEEAASISPGREQSVSVFAKLFTLIGRLILFSIKLLAVIIGFALAFAAIGIIISIIAVATGKSISFLGSNVFFEDPSVIFAGMSGITPGGFVAMILGIVFIPIAILAYLIFRLIFNIKNNRTLMWILGGTWILLAVYTMIITIDNIDRLRENIQKIDSHYAPACMFDIDTENIKEIGLLVINGDTVIRNDNIMLHGKFSRYATVEKEGDEYTGTIIVNGNDTIANNHKITDMNGMVATMKKMMFRNNFKLDIVSNDGNTESTDTYIDRSGNIHTRTNITILNNTGNNRSDHGNNKQ